MKPKFKDKSVATKSFFRQNLLRPNCGEAVGNPAVGLVVVLGDLRGTALLDVPEKVFDLNKMCLRFKPNFGNYSCNIYILVNQSITMALNSKLC